MRQRTCIVTRAKRPDTELLRIVVDPVTQPKVSNNSNQLIRVVADPDRRLPGRGAWITPDLKSCQLAVERRAIARALKLSQPVDASALIEYVSLLDEL